MMRAVIFTGPTLPAADAAAALPCMVLPPARQGDIWRAVRAHAPLAIGLIDGVFLDVPAVWHRELLWALTQGVHLFGAASMGALRAAELAAFGMRGVGRVFEAYRDGAWPGFDGAFEDDDEVAVVHAPMEAGGSALSDAMVDVRDTLLAAEAASLMDRAERHAVASVLKAAHFPSRGMAALADAADALLGPRRGAALRAWLPGGRVARKRDDAREMVRVMAAFLATDPSPFVPAFQFERALVWERFTASASAPAEGDDPATAAILDELRLDPPAWRVARRAAMGRIHALAAAPPPARGAERAAFAAFREDAGLGGRDEIEAWLTDAMLDGAGLTRLMREEAALDAAAAASRTTELAPALLDHLRLTGGLTRLRRRAEAKRRGLERDGAWAAPSGPHQDAALRWFIEHRMGAPGHTAVADAAARAGFENEDVFRAAVWREYLFVHRRPSGADPPGATAAGIGDGTG